MWTIHHADCLEYLRQMPDESIDAVVTDPPYGLSEHKPAEVAACLAAWIAGEPYTPKGRGFMGRAWDAWVPGPEVWREVLRVLKPGGHALIFAGSRTQDLMGMAVRLASFEMRDTLQWLYGSGFPKSLDVSKAIDKEAGAVREVVGSRPRFPDGGRGAKAGTKAAFGGGVVAEFGAEVPVTAPATDAARQWSGWGTALKPAYEPIILARKPMRGTVAASVQAHGTGAINVDGCRIAHASADDLATSQAKNPGRLDTVHSGVYGGGRPQQHVNASGRWPANVLLDEWHERVLVLTDNEHEQSFREFFSNHDSVRDLWSPPTHPAVAAHAGAVLQSEMLRAVALREQARGPAPHAREDSLGRVDCKDGGVFEGQREVRRGFGSVEGRQVQEQGVHDGVGVAPDGRSGRHRKADDGEGEGLRPGASTCRGVAAGETLVEDRGRSPSERQEVGQQPGEPGIDGRSGPQAGTCIGSGGTTAGAGDNRRPALRAAESDVPLMWRAYFSDSGLTVRRGSAAVLDAQSGDGGPGLAASVGGASRFFYVAKASPAERDAGLQAEAGERANVHPTVKPVALMRWLARLITPPGGVVLDPFTGSGTTGVACMAEGLRFIGIEADVEYVEIARARVAHAAPPPPAPPTPATHDAPTGAPSQLCLFA